MHFRLQHFCNIQTSTLAYDVYLWQVMKLWDYCCNILTKELLLGQISKMLILRLWCAIIN